MKKIAFFILLIFSIKSFSQCVGGTYISSFPYTFSGITVSQTFLGDVYHDVNSYNNCGVICGPTWLGRLVGTGSPFTQTLTFSSPVNNMIYILNASDSESYAYESFTFTVNTGILSCTQNAPTCPYTQISNSFNANSSPGINGHSNAAFITLSSSLPYTSTTVNGTGGCNGSYMGLCTALFNGIKTTNSINDKIQVYPNPTSGKFTIETNSTEKQTVQVFDVNGRVVLIQNINGSTTIDVSNLNEGVYNLSIKSSKGVINKKLVIVR